ncbi:MAG TPA: FAD-dependent oxidoreductase [Vicinamibacterales bacterium]|nr:FAD-dependent oxidoreductase [Vicinamibacterales bacterium]
MNEIDIAVIGGGVVGLSCALKLAESGASVCMLERETRPGRGMSTHNSGVIHAGIYYPAGSLKARLCIEGRPRLYEFCERYHVAHQRCGKLLVAGDTREISELEALHARGASNGATSLEIVDVNFVRRKEPHVHAVAAIWSPDTGIVEAEGLIGVLAGLCRDRDVAMLVGTSVVGASSINGGIEIVTPHERFIAHTVINAAGLYADDISAMLGGTRFQIRPCRGEYAELAPAKRGLVNGLVYPLPNADGSGLGVHLTRTTWGSVLIGPTAQFQDSKDDYEGARLPLDAFVEPTRALLPRITLADLQPGGTGIRAKLHGPSDKFADFLIERDSQNPHVIQVAGIESPGLTSCLAIAELVASLYARS